MMTRLWLDGPRGVRRGLVAIKAELGRQLAVGGPTTVEITSLLAQGRTVMTEAVHSFKIGGNPVSARVMAAFDIDPNGRIHEWRESYDLKSVTDQF